MGRLVLASALLLLLLAGAGAVNAAQAGQIVVDPNNPAWLKREGGGPFFLCAPGDPEGFLYRGARQADGTRGGDQIALIEKLKGTGANGIYMQMVRSHGGDGGSTENPFVNSDPSQGLDADILNQWETWFTEMDDAGITIYLFFYDDSSVIWSGDAVGSAEQSFIQGIVNRFEHHKNLVWVVAEEYQEAYSAARAKNIAAAIRAADDNDHAIAVHKLNGLDFSEFADNPDIDQFAIQYNVDSASALHAGMVQAWNNAAGKYNLNMSEAAGHATDARKKNWAIALGGANTMVIGWDIASTSSSDLQDCGKLVSFMESTNFNEMAPHDELAFGGTQYVLAKPGDSYIAYASNLSGQMGLKGLAAGTYDLRWFDIPSGTFVNQLGIQVNAGDQSFAKPAGIGNEVAVHIKKSGSGPPSTVFPGTAWATKTPAELGLDGAKLDQFAANVGGDGVIVKDGYIVKTWGCQDCKADWASAMKPVMSTMLMFAVKEGKLASVDAPVRPVVQQLFGKDLIAKDQSMTFRHLANMVSGYALPEAPGAAWAYNDYAINLYSKTLFDGVFKQTPNAAATAANRLGALQFQDGSIFGSRTGYGLSTTPRDFARIGWFWLNKGNWNGTQLLPASYFDQYMKPGVPASLPRTQGGTNDYLNVYFSGGGTDQTPNGPGIYGFNWWFNGKGAGHPNSLTWPDAPPDTFQANGHWNLEVVTVIPSLNMVIAARGNWGSFQPGSPGKMNDNLRLAKEAVTGGLPPECTLGQKRDCYSGPAGTEGIGACTAGEETCTAAGRWPGTCAGERTPAAEACDDGIDGDCDGETDEADCTREVVVTNLSVKSGKTYEVGTLNVNERVYIDRDYVFTNVPGNRVGQKFIRTANDDKTAPDPNFLSFTVNQDVTTCMAYDARATSPPNPVNTWTKTGETLSTNDAPLNLYCKDFTAGTITLPGNMAPGASGASSNYVVVLEGRGGEPPACGAGELLCGEACTVPACSVNADCDDGDTSTDDACQDPATCSAACVNAPVQPVCAGDANDDKVVNVLDLVTIVNCMNNTLQLLACDQNNDSVVNVLDLVLSALELGKAC